MIEQMLTPLHIQDLLTEAEQERRIADLPGSGNAPLRFTTSIQLTLGGRLVGIGSWLVGLGQGLQHAASTVCCEASVGLKH